MRNKEFIAEHRGGLLRKDKHILLIQWAIECAEHVLSAFTDVSTDTRPIEALTIARAWAIGNKSVGDARNAAFAAHDAAREIKELNKAASEAARAAGHAVATAHMADHSLQAAKYALKAAKYLSLSVDDELRWQNEQLPEEIKELVMDAREENDKN